MVYFLELNKQIIVGKKVLELGCGSSFIAYMLFFIISASLAGVTCIHLGASAVVCTDSNSEVIGFCQKTLNLNKCDVGASCICRSEVHSWGDIRGLKALMENVQMNNFDIALGCDIWFFFFCLYYYSLFEVCGKILSPVYFGLPIIHYLIHMIYLLDCLYYHRHHHHLLHPHHHHHRHRHPLIHIHRQLHH
jgi:hypothetical protein